MENNFKRFLSLLLAFVMVLGMFPMAHVHAEEESIWIIGDKVSSVEADATYVICLHNSMNALSNIKGKKDWGTDTLATGACDKYADARILWTLEPAEGGYKLKNESGYLNISRNTASLNETGHVFELVNNGDDGWAIKSLETNEYGNNLGDSGSIGGWSGDGTKFDIYAVTEVSLAEVDTYGKMRGLWSMVEVDSQTEYDAKEGLFAYAFDNDSNTIWHSNWQGGSDKVTNSDGQAGNMEFIAGVIDFGQAYTINQFSFTPRQGNNSGQVTKASLYVKETEEAEWILVAEHATFAADQSKKDMDFETQAVRYVKFVAEQSNDGWVAVSEFDIDYIPSRVEQLVAEMSLRDKVTQMLMVDFRKWGATSAKATDFTVMNDEVREIVENYNFGSVIYFANNIKTTEETFALTQEMQAAATKDGGIALIICADQEGGSVYRLGSGTALPGNMALGATYAANDTKYAYEAGKIIGSELSSLGINGNLAPVVDVNNNANNPVIGLRSYGDDAVMVGELASASIAGMAEYNVIGTAKHFPGHGDTATDSHYGLPMVDKSLDVLMETELAPYTVAIEEGIEMIMTAHILYPQLESDKIVSNKTGEPESLPATMSDDILTGLLKEQMGFEGIVVTDAMNMAGISDSWDQVQSCVIAIQSGVDLICMPCQLYCKADLTNLDKIIDGIIAAVEDGTIPMERINDAVTRILTVKENRGILDYKAEDYTLENAQAVVGSDENREMERELAAAAVTVIKNDGSLPLNLTGDSKVLMMVPYNNERAQMLMAWNRAMEAGLIPAGAQVDYVTFSKTSTIESLKAKMDWADTLIINSEISSTTRYKPGGSYYWLYNIPNQICDYAAANGKKAIISSVDKPYDVQMYANANAIVAAYGCKGSSVDPTEALIGGATGSVAAYGPNIIAAVEVILGTFAAQGKLPVNIPVLDMDSRTYTDEIAYERGYGLTYEAKVGHEHIYENVVADPTCTEEGYTAQECTICDYRIILEKAAALGHTDEVIPGKGATCTESGLTEGKKCSVCGEVLTAQENIPALGHNYEATEVVDPTCTESGYTVYTCSLCGDSYEDDPTEPEHQFDECVVTAPTCTEKGFTTYTCTVCGEEYVDEASWVDALGHTAAEAVRENDKAPTCSEAGSYDMVVYCSVCGVEMSRETSTVGALGHTAAEAVVENKVTYSCGAESYDNVVYCSVCGEELSREHVDVPGTGEHNFVLADGKLFCDCGTGYTGPYASNQFFYRDGIRVNNYVLVEYNGDYYFISDYHKYVKNDTRYLSAKVLEGTDFLPGYYEFDENGKMNTAVKNGVIDGYLYIENVQQKAYKLVKYDGDYYFIGDYNKVVMNETIYLSAQILADTNFEPGYFDFDADGKMIIKNGAAEDGFFYIDGVKQKAYQLVKTDEGDYYFISDYHKYVKSERRYLSAKVLEGTDFLPGYYEFDAEGKMNTAAKNGVIDGYLYINDVKQTAYKLVEFDGAYYFISDYNKVIMGVRRYMTAQALEGTGLKAGYYEFGADGKMIIE